jgi:hypothetical protein
LFTAAQQLGALPARREALAKQEALKEQLSNLDPNTPQGLAGIASIYQQQGDMGNALKFATAARELTAKNLDVAQKAKETTLEETQAEGREALTALATISGFDIDENPQDRKSFLQEASFYKIGPKEAREIYESINPEEKTGTLAKPETITLFDKESGQNMEYAIYRDDKGVIQKTLIGPAEKKKEDEEVDLGLDTKWGSDLLKESREKGREAEANAILYNDLADTAGQREFYERGFLGKTLSSVEEGFGVAGQATVHRRRINQIRMSGALELLPTGPASDKDVALAMDSSIDPNNLSNEDAESYLRGMAKIAAAEAEYYNKKRDFIQETKDPNAVGYDFWVKKEGLKRDLDEMKSLSPEAMSRFNEKVNQAASLEDPQERQAALNALKTTFPKITNLMSDIEIAERQWEDFSKGKNLKGFY